MVWKRRMGQKRIEEEDTGVDEDGGGDVGGERSERDEVERKKKRGAGGVDVGVVAHCVWQHGFPNCFLSGYM